VNTSPPLLPLLSGPYTAVAASRSFLNGFTFWIGSFLFAEISLTELEGLIGDDDPV